MKIYILSFFFLLTNISFSQQDFICGMGENYVENFPRYYQTAPPQIGGYTAPAKTLNGANVKILCIFAQFLSDTKDPNDPYWQVGQMPEWANTFIGTNPSQAPFPANTISNYFYEMSNGTNIIIGEVYPSLVIIDKPMDHPYGSSNLAVLQEVDLNLNYSNFDKWNMMTSYKQIYNQTDNYVDAVYIIWRNIGVRWGGKADLGTTYPTNDGVTISNRIPTISMTLNIGGRSIYSIEPHLSLLAHEYGHYLFGPGHNFENSGCGGTAQRGLGIMNSGSGGTLAMNPHEKYLLGYTTYTDLFYNQAGSLSDYQTSNACLRIPIPLYKNGVLNINPTEFFIVANHQKFSPYELTKTRGIYIYHVKSLHYSHNHMDMITADGIWDWTVIDWVDPAGLGGSSDWYCDQYNKPPPEKLPIIKRAAVNFLSGRDELQEVVRASYPVVGSPYYGRLYWWDKWFDENCNRVESPLGDNEDAFNNGYNELFTTYSNPPSYNKDRLPTDTGIKFFQPSGSNVFHFEFYNSDTAIIDAPPSKPQNLKIAKSPNNHPYLTWAANLERDVLSYKIQKRLDLYLPWQDLATTTQNSYEDLTEEYLPYGPTINIAYRIIAKDNQMLESCPSDLCETRVYGNPQKDNNSKEVFTIDCYRLDQNYPNPFNPTTVIHYDVKNSGRVQLKIFDILGKEVAFLVDQHKETGSYSVNFDATNLPSGVYIYSISINDFVQSKKMSLVR